MPNLPKAAWLYCQGTIASRHESNLETIAYSSCPGALDDVRLSQMIDMVPEISKVVEISETKEVNAPSSAAEYLTVAKWIKSLDPDLPVVVTRGTGTVPDMACFFDAVLDRPAPVIFTGAMRPISALSCDGQYNLVQAFSLAVHPSSRNRGVMLLFSDRISPAYYALKTSSSRLDTFKCFEAGHLGLMNNLTPHYFYEPVKATNKPFFDISNLEDLPKVALLTCYLDQDLDDLDRKAADKDVKGIVLAGVGTSSLSSEWRAKASELAEQGMPIVRTSTCADSHVTTTYGIQNQIAAGDLGPAKSYLLLRLAIACFGQDIKKIRQAFGTDFAPIAVPA